MEEEQDPIITGFLSLLWRLPPENSAEDTINCCQLCPGDKADAILKRVQRPGRTIADGKGMRFLGTDFNKVLGLYRAPSTQEYYRADGTKASPEEQEKINSENPKHLAELETFLNDKFEIYREHRFPNGFSSTYAWSIPDGFVAAVAFKSEVNFSTAKEEHSRFIWDSIFVTHVSLTANRPCYRTKGTVYLTIRANGPRLGEVGFGGRMVRTREISRVFSERGSFVSEKDIHFEAMCDLIDDIDSGVCDFVRECSLPQIRQLLLTMRILPPEKAQAHGELLTQFNAELRKGAEVSHPGGGSTERLDHDP